MTIKQVLPTIGLAVLLGLLWGLWQQVQVFSEKAAAQAFIEPVKPLLSFDSASVTGFRIHHRGRPDVSGALDRSRVWLLESPFAAAADAYAVDRALGIIGRITVARRIAGPGADLAEFGLKDPALSVELRVGGVRRWLAVGGASTDAEYLYAHSSDHEDIVMIARKAIHPIPAQATELLDLRVVPLTRDPLHTIEVQGKDSVIRLQAGTDGWAIRVPIVARADRSMMAEWLLRLNNLIARSASPAGPGTGIGSGATRLGTILLAAGNVRQSVEFLLTPTGLRARRSDHPGLWYDLAEQDASAFLPELFQLWDKHILPDDPRTIQAIAIRNLRRTIRFERIESQWGERSASAGHPSAVIAGWLADLALSQGTRLVPEAERCGISPRTRWTIILHRNGEQPTRIELARTRSCGDVATLPNGDWVQLDEPRVLNGLIDGTLISSKI